MSNPPIIVQPCDVTPGDRRLRHRERRVAHRARRREQAAQRRAERGPVNVVLWIPSTLIFTLLSPFAILLTPFLYLAPRDVIEDPAHTVAALGRVLLSMGGTVVEVDAPDTHIHLRLF